jgi:tight adherence protein C
MDYLFALFSSYVPDPAHQRLLLVGFAALVVFLFAIGVSAFASARLDPARRRLDELAPEARAGRATDTFVAWIERAARYVLPKKSSERDTTQRRLVYAGFRGSNAVTVFYGTKACIAAGLVVMTVLATRWLPQVSTSGLGLFVLLAAGVGLAIPNIVLRNLVERRQRALRNGFPDALDMLVVCVEAGLGLTAAIQRVADELRFSHPELASELALVNAETRAGVERETALKNLTDRTGLDDVRGLVSLLVQTLRFGTSVADTLRVYSEEFRDKRMQHAEELAAKVGTKLIFPLVLCLFPSFFIVAIGPAVLRIVAALSQLGTTVTK